MPWKFLLICGILSSLLYAGMNIHIRMFCDGYTSGFQAVSELSDAGAPTWSQWVSPGIVHALFVVVFGWGVLQPAG